MPALSCSMKDLVPWTGIALGPPALEGQSFDHWTTKKVPFFLSPKIAILPIVLLTVPHRLEPQAGRSASSLLLAVYLLTLSLPSGDLTCSGEACTIISALWLRICSHFLRLWADASPSPSALSLALIFSDFKSELTLQIPWPHAYCLC